MKLINPFSDLIEKDPDQNDISYLMMIALVIFMVVLSETALVFSTGGAFLLVSNLFYFPLILLNLKFFTKGLSTSTAIGLIYFLIAVFLVNFDIEGLLIGFSMMLTYIAVGISISMISKTSNESKKTLIKSISNYENLFEEIQDAIIVYDSEGLILGVNNAASTLLGLEKKYVRFLKIDDLKNFIDEDALKKAFYDVSLSGSGFTDTELRQSDGNIVYIEIHSSIIDSSKGVMRAYIRDVTDRVIAEKKIIASETRYRHLTNQLPEMIFELDIDGNFCFATRYSINIAGRTPEELSGGLKLWDVLVEEDRDRARKNLEWFFKGMFLGAVEYRVKKPDGSIIPVLVHFSYDFDDDSSVRGIKGIAMDISQRKRMEMALRRNEKKFRSLFENSNDAVIIFNRDGMIMDINTRLCNMLGIKRDEAVSQDLKCRFPESEWDKVSGMYEVSSSGGIFFESRMQHREGDYIDVEISSGIIDPEEGLYQAILRDISERKRGEVELAVSRERLNLAIEGAGVCVWDWDIERDEMYFEGNYDEMFGQVKEHTDRSGSMWREILQQEFYKIIMDYYADNGNSSSTISDLKSKQFESEYKFKTETGLNRWITVLGKVVDCDSDGNPVRIAGIMQDVSDKRMYQDALYEANKKLNLLSSITRHDILNQIAGVRGFTDILSKRLPEENSELQHYLDRIKKATSNIQEQITFTRDYQNIGVETPSWQNLEKIIESSRSKAQLRNIAFFNDCRGLEIYADPMIEKIFFNLLDNTIRHGGDVTEIEVKCRKNSDCLTIIFRDNGKGVSCDLKEKIFDHGYGSNTGLGLFLVREILGITGMGISEVGEPGKGAVFEIQIPADHAREVR
ncbi:MAG: PAS domain S-box protein [Methanomicrobiaceae archaeon]|nr:PAS domain S-box protein [Methanomicrobiaceae archaeon]